MDIEHKPEKYCEACGILESKAYNGVDVYDRWNGVYPTENKTKVLCWLCASTASGNTVDHYELYPNRSGTILNTICFIGNLLLKEENKQ